MRNWKRMISCFLMIMLVLTSVFSQADLSLAAGKKMKLSTKKVSLKVGKSKTVKLKNAPKKAKASWKSKNPKIAKVSKKGKITAKKKGSTKVTCKVKYPKEGKTKTAKFTVSVKVTEAGKKTAETLEPPAALQTQAPSASPKVTGTPKASPTLKPSEDPEPSQIPQSSENPEPSQIPQSSENPEPSQIPQSSENPEPSQAPQSSENPMTSEEPTNTKKPSATAWPEKTPPPTPVPVKQEHSSYRILSSDELTQEMGAGWNLGNTMDGHTGFTPGETVWQPYMTTKGLMKSIHDMGFNTVRIPVTWGTMIDDENGYAIDEKWMNRVQDIVDYCISEDMYAIINVHHDGAEQSGWLRIATDDQKALEEKYAGVWKNIAMAFRDYDEHLILESMNEVQGSGMSVAEENAVIMKLNQIFVNTVRETGSNNAQRWLMVPGKFNYIDSVCNPKHNFALPQDETTNRLIVSIHDYSPWSFCGPESMSGSECTAKMLENNDKELKPMYDTYTSKGIPVVVGEYGCVNKNNPEDRAYYLEAMNRMFRKYKLVGVYWDQGWYDKKQEPADYSFTIVDRKTGKPLDKTITDGLMRGILGLDGATDPLELSKPPEVIPVTNVTLPLKELSLQMDESITMPYSYKPANSNDVILWKTEDPSVATVAYGTIHAKGIGKTVITMYSQNSDIKTEIPVTVTAAESVSPCESISTSADSFELKEKESAWIGASLSPADCDEWIYYRSADESVATVSSVGKILAVGSGKTEITVGTSGGKSKTIAVKVTKEAAKQEIRLAVNVYYNDKGHNYYGNEVSTDIITVTEDGQYTLTFDCDKDLSKKAKEAGVTNLNHVGAIYIKDQTVTEGDATESPLFGCDIRYDEVDVDGTKLTVTNTDFKSALKESGIFDTNDPINGYDGSAVEEVKVSGNVVSFTSVTDPKKITITFTLQDMEF